jgi:hypothetical protein
VDYEADPPAAEEAAVDGDGDVQIPEAAAAIEEVKVNLLSKSISQTAHLF